MLAAEVHFTETFDSENREELKSDLTGKEVVLGWSKAIAEDLSIGLQGRLAPADLIHEAFSSDLGDQPVRYATDQFGVALWLGVLGQLNERVTAGAVMRLGWIESETDVKNLTALGLIPPHTTLEKVEDDAQILGLKAGLGWALTESMHIYTDGHYLGVDSNYTGSTEIGRALVGLEQKFSESLKGIAGMAYDKESECSEGLGFSMQMKDGVSANVSYQYNSAPEMENEFSRVDYLNASLAVLF